MKYLVVMKATRYTMRFPWILVIHQVEVQVGSCRIAGMANIDQMLAWSDFVTWRSLDRACLGMGIDCISVAALKNGVVAGQRPEVYRPVEIECQGMLE
jgi:hypothetical protein